MTDTFFDEVWYVLTDPLRPGEHLTLSAAEVKYALVWTTSKGALTFSRELSAAKGMRVVPLYSWTLKDAFLAASEQLGASHLLIDYQPGLLHTAASPIRVARKRIRPES